jgi:hypothetical protein
MAPAFVQTTTPENRLVQAFRACCIETRAEPELVRAEVERARSQIQKGVAKFTSGGASDRWPGGAYDTLEVSDSIDPHDRLTVGFGGPIGGPGRHCEVKSPWGKIREIVSALAAAGIADDASTVAFDDGIRAADANVPSPERVAGPELSTYDEGEASPGYALSSRPTELDGVHITACSGARGWLDAGDKPRHDQSPARRSPSRSPSCSS